MEEVIEEVEQEQEAFHEQETVFGRPDGRL